MPKIRLNDKAIKREAPAVGQIELWDDLVPGFGLRIAAKGARTYFVMKRLNGRLVRRTVGKAPPPDYLGALGPDELRLGDAREKARQMLADLSRGVDPAAKAVPAKVKANPTTFGEVAAAYFADPARRGGATLKSRGELERKVRVDLAKWKDIPITDLTRAESIFKSSAEDVSAFVMADRANALVQVEFRRVALTADQVRRA